MSLLLDRQDKLESQRRMEALAAEEKKKRASGGMFGKKKKKSDDSDDDEVDDGDEDEIEAEGVAFLRYVNKKDKGNLTPIHLAR